jgi:hypothetical protein
VRRASKAVLHRRVDRAAVSALVLVCVSLASARAAAASGSGLQELASLQPRSSCAQSQGVDMQTAVHRHVSSAPPR